MLGAVGFTGLRKPRFKYCGRCLGEEFKCWEFAAEMVEGNSELCTKRLCENCYNERRVEMTEQTDWRRLVGDMRSRGRVEVSLRFLGLGT